MKEMMELNLVRGYGNVLNSSTINSFNTNENCILFDNQEYLEWEHNKLYGYKIKLNEELLSNLTLFTNGTTLIQYDTANITIKAKNDDDELVQDILIHFYLDGVFVDKKYITNTGATFNFSTEKNDNVELKFIFKGNIDYDDTELIINQNIIRRAGYQFKMVENSSHTGGTATFTVINIDDRTPVNNVYCKYTNENLIFTSETSGYTNNQGIFNITYDYSYITVDNPRIRREINKSNYVFEELVL